MENKTILTTIVGSQAHGLATPESDLDVRGVFVVPTEEILSLNYKEKSNSWVEGEKVDATAYEIKHFLNLCLHSNSTVLEVLNGPVKVITPLGQELKDLFPYLWSSDGVKNAFTGYSKNQEIKYMDNKDLRPRKYACAMIRTLILGIELLKYGTMTLDVGVQENAHGDEFLNIIWPRVVEPGFRSVKEALFSVKSTDWPKGDVINWSEYLKKELLKAYASNSNKKSDISKAEEFLLKVRRYYL
jgi:predicted nucleotidyltransferase